MSKSFENSQDCWNIAQYEASANLARSVVASWLDDPTKKGAASDDSINNGKKVEFSKRPSQQISYKGQIRLIGIGADSETERKKINANVTQEMRDHRIKQRLLSTKDRSLSAVCHTGERLPETEEEDSRTNALISNRNHKKHVPEAISTTRTTKKRKKIGIL